MAEAFITFASTDAYALGALVLGHSIRATNTTKQLCIMVTNTVSESLRALLSEVFDHMEEVNVLDSRDTMNLGLLSRPDLGVTFTKLHCWRLTQYSKGVFMDADTMVLQNIDDLFNYEEFSASPDPGWPDCFNSGVFVFRPNVDTYASLLQFAVNKGSFDGGDQGLLNMYFSDWRTADIKKHLPFTYNCVSQAFYSYLPAVTHFRNSIRVIHFIGPVKPWHHDVDPATGEVVPQKGTGFFPEFLQHWYSIFTSQVKSKLPTDMEKLATQLTHLNIVTSPHSTPSPQPPQYYGGGGGGGAEAAQFSQSNDQAQKVDDRERQYMWERGEIDYTGTDRFEQIKSKIDSTIKDSEAKTSKEDHPAKKDHPKK